MSHVASVKCYVNDLDALERVAGTLGFDLIRGAKTYEWFGEWVNDFRGQTAAVDQGYDPKTFGTCEHKLRRKDHRHGMYEVGVVARSDGKPGYELIYDNWSSGGQAVEEKAGRGLTRLKSALAEDLSTRALLRQGYRVRRTVDANGVVKLVATR